MHYKLGEPFGTSGRKPPTKFSSLHEHCNLSQETDEPNADS